MSLDKTMITNYTIESGKLVVRDSTTGKILWSGNFEGFPVFRLLPLELEGDCLVLLDPGASKKPTFENLLRVKANGTVVWHAKIMNSAIEPLPAAAIAALRRMAISGSCATYRNSA